MTFSLGLFEKGQAEKGVTIWVLEGFRIEDLDSSLRNDFSVNKHPRVEIEAQELPKCLKAEFKNSVQHNTFKKIIKNQYQVTRSWK